MPLPLPLNNLCRARPLLGTFVEITATGSGENTAKAIEAAFSAIEQVHRLMSFHGPESDVSRVNASEVGCEVEIDPQTYQVLQFACELGDLSDGAFDIATADALIRVGFLPCYRYATQLDPLATYQDIELLGEHRLRWRRKGRIDLGGIAKGYAVDCAIAVLKSFGIDTGIVNAGGDLRCFGAAQQIHVRHPITPTALVSVGWLTNASIATSGGYFAGISGDDGRIEPLVDPKQRACTSWGESVSVVAPDCMTADALTKIVRLVPERAPELLDRFKAQAVVIDDQSMRTCGAMLLQKDMI
jgi:thiamine biosynthesis lipoprotein